VRIIPQYRLYATSLLFLYDGASKDEIDALDEESGIKYSPDVRVKIVDFAHALTDLHAPDVLSAPFPPLHPENADRGYIKGLTSIKTYFQKYPPLQALLI
jgi:inositol-hexakisphosphate kinase